MGCGKKKGRREIRWTRDEGRKKGEGGIRKRVR